MKIGILTYHWVSNMGANLQALSTYKCLEKMGHMPIIINWIPSDVESYYINSVSPEQRKAHQTFSKTHFRSVTKLCRTNEDVADQIIANDIHFVCVGSDAVFSTKPILSRWHLCRRGLVYNKPYSDATISNPFWGAFKKYLPVDYPIEIVAVSASAQNSPYRQIIFSREKKAYSNALKRFSKITVRDIWTQNMCKYVSNNIISPNITPDPVFAFNRNVTPTDLKYVRNTLGISGKYVLLSVASTIKDDAWILTLEQLFAKVGIVAVGLPKTNSPFKNILKHNLEFPMDPMEWYDAIKYSQGYIGELMHPILVSLHNAVPVYAFDTYGFRHNFKFDTSSSKTYQILKKFDLLQNYYNPKMNQIPSPEDVFSKIISTDRVKIQEKSEDMLRQYCDMMSYLVSNADC